MNGRSGLVTFFLFMFLAVMILLQMLSMIQSDRLYERLNVLLDRLETRTTTARAPQDRTTPTRTDLPMQEYPGDEGDWLVWRLEGEPSTLMDIHASGSMYTRYIVSGNIFESLLRYNPDEFKLEPWLAESYDVSENGLEITFRLRNDIHFSDGHPITADDVIFTYETIVNPDIDAANLANYYRDVDHVEKIDDREVRFYMKNVYFKSLEFCGGMEILPTHIYKFDDPDEFNKHVSDPVGSGPYIFEKWDVSQQVVLTRNENYWGHKPKIKKIIYPFITNDTAAVQALRTGNTDYMRPLPDQYHELSNDDEFTKYFNCLSYWHPAVGYFWIGWNQDRPFFKDRRVRLAMTHLIDREKICKYLLRNPEALVPTGNFYIFGPQSNPDIKPWPYNPKKAVQLLDEAGWVDTDGDGIRDKNGVPFKFKYMIVSGLQLHEQVAKLVKDAAAKVGIEVTLEPYEGSVFFQKAHDREFDAINMAWAGGLAGDPYQIWHSSQIGNHGSNYVGFNNPEADAIIEEARRTLDDDKRNKMYHRFHSIIHEEQPYTFIYTRPEQRFLDKRFRNVKIHKLGLDEHEWYVPAHLQKYK
jgi:peptide/nickel transport system substrate-binding protein